MKLEGPKNNLARLGNYDYDISISGASKKLSQVVDSAYKYLLVKVSQSGCTGCKQLELDTTGDSANCDKATLIQTGQLSAWKTYINDSSPPKTYEASLDPILSQFKTNKVPLVFIVDTKTGAIVQSNPDLYTIKSTCLLP